MAGLAVGSAPGGVVAAGLATGTAIAADVYANYDGDWQKWLVDHPGMVDTLIGMSPGMLSSLGVPVDLASTLDLLAATYADGTADVKYLHTYHDTGPHNLRDILLGLDERNSPTNKEPSNIDVRIIKDANGNVTGYVVDVPGTKHWNAPWDPKSANDTGVNIDAMADNNTANRTTVTFENQTGTVGENHSIGGYRENADQSQNPRVDRNYVAVAGQLDQSSDPSVRRFLDSTDAFTQGGPASQMRTYQVTREGVK